MSVALNMFKVRKWAALLLCSLLSVMFFYTGTVLWGFWWGLCFLGCGVLVGVLVGFFLLKNPFTEMLEGNGILALDFNSTGVIRPFIIGVQDAFVKGKVNGHEMSDVFDRSAVMNLANPVKNVRKAELGAKLGEEGVKAARDVVAELAVKAKDAKAAYDGASGLIPVDKVLVRDTKKAYKVALRDFEKAEREYKLVLKKFDETPSVGVRIELDELTYNKARFALFHYPVIIWNDQIKSVLTKDLLSDLEKDVFAEHTVLYLNRKMEELTSVVRDFGRYVVELTKPSTEWYKSKWVWIVLVVGLVLLGLLFAPSIIKTVSGAMSTVGDAASSATGAAVTAR